MWIDITVALASALIGTYFGTFFLAKREENKVKKVRAIAICLLFTHKVTQFISDQRSDCP